MSKSRVFTRVKPFLAVLFLQFGLAGMDIISKAALNERMSNYVFVVYYHAIATVIIAPFAIILEKKVRPKMTKAMFGKFILLGLLEPVIDQNLYLLGMKNTTATFAAALCNILPAITFVVAWIFGLEKVKLKSIRSQAKIGGTLTTIGGAMLMTLVKGPVIHLIWTKGKTPHLSQSSKVDLKHSVIGSLMITAGCFSWACFMVLQSITLETYPAELSLTAWICLMGTVEGAAAALVMERGNPTVWSINFDTKLLAAVYSGVFCSGLGYYVQGIIMKERGPVFVTAFSPLNMIIVAVLGSFFLAEQIFLGGVIGAFVISAGLYLVVWGKSKDHKPQDLSIDNEKEEKTEEMIKACRINDEKNHKVLSIDNEKEVKSEQMIEGSRINDEENYKVLSITESKEESKETDKSSIKLLGFPFL
ncbi:WAT1-related protein At2g37460-like [Apium graveolens]|uniref:WAT1-related protein At2g37460-like n=1 Tax=Apium graveolens TaxID=4045 RepID=UPI003D7BABAF